MIPQSNKEIHRRLHLPLPVLRFILLLCVSFLSLGAHFGSYILGPLHKKFQGRQDGNDGTGGGSGEIVFGVLLSSFQVLSTVTSLMGFLVPRLGTPLSGFICTGSIALGLGLVWIMNAWENIWGMIIGLFIFGLGISPISVVQETIVVRHFSRPSSSEGTNRNEPRTKSRPGTMVAIALLAGKASSFLASLLSSPLSKAYGPNAPFLVAFLLAVGSLGLCGVYWWVEGEIAGRRVGERSGEGDGVEEEEEERRPLLRGLEDEEENEWNPSRGHFRNGDEQESDYPIHPPNHHLLPPLITQTINFGDPFWCYIVMCALFGALNYPFIHFSSDILQTLFQTSDQKASMVASTVLAASVILYPLLGPLLDHFSPTTTTNSSQPSSHSNSSFDLLPRLFFLSSSLQLCSFIILQSQWLRDSLGIWGGILGAAVAVGSEPLGLVVAISRVVDMEYVSTGLGVHKSLERGGACIMQAIIAFILSRSNSDSSFSSTSSSFITTYIDLTLNPNPNITFSSPLPHPAFPRSLSQPQFQSSYPLSEAIPPRQSSILSVLKLFTLVNVVHLGVVVLFGRLIWKRRLARDSRESREWERSGRDEVQEEGDGIAAGTSSSPLTPPHSQTGPESQPQPSSSFASASSRSSDRWERRRGRLFLFLTTMVIIFAWVSFGVSLRLARK